MAEPPDPKDLVTIEDLALSNMGENAALIEWLHENGLVTKPEILDKITELRRKHPQATTLAHDQAVPSAQQQN